MSRGSSSISLLTPRLGLRLRSKAKATPSASATSAPTPVAGFTRISSRDAMPAKDVAGSPQARSAASVHLRPAPSVEEMNRRAAAMVRLLRSGPDALLRHSNRSSTGRRPSSFRSEAAACVPDAAAASSTATASQTVLDTSRAPSPAFRFVIDQLPLPSATTSQRTACLSLSPKAGHTVSGSETACAGDRRCTASLSPTRIHAAAAATAFPVRPMSAGASPLAAVTPANSGPIVCAVCLCDFTPGDRVARLPCSPLHVFHQACVLPWLSLRNRCPMCSKNIDASNEAETNNIVEPVLAPAVVAPELPA